jgi:hypothetical protein
MLLESTVILPEDDADTSKWNCYRFQIRYAREPTDKSVSQVTRVFSCPREGRDAWVYAINQALLGYEKEKDKARKHSVTVSSSPHLHHFSMSWTNDHFPSAADGRATPKSKFNPTAPTSPRCDVKRPLPRPKPSLIGESAIGV